MFEPLTAIPPPKPPASCIPTAVLLMNFVSVTFTLSPWIAIPPPTVVNALISLVTLNLKSCVAELFVKLVLITVVLDAEINAPPPRTALLFVKLVLLISFNVPLTYIPPPITASLLTNVKYSIVVL